jgi:isopenicillin N synthase-like dioxygenase
VANPDICRALNISETKNGKIIQPLPPCIMNREAEIARFSDLCNKTCIQILDLLAHGLEVRTYINCPLTVINILTSQMPDDFFTSRHDSSKGYTGNSVRLLYYPSNIPGYRPGKDIRAGAHSDYGSITLLFQRPGQPGLEIQTPEGEWAPVPVYPNQDEYPFPPILVNIGDALSYWTDGLLKSTVHRVVFPDGAEGADRYSIAFFCSPVGTTELSPLPSDVVTAHRERGKEDVNSTVGYGGGASELNVGGRRLTAGEHLQARLAATYL